jgi:hypothetical protein
MRTRFICSIATVTLVLAACGGGDGASGKQGEVADQLVASASEAGLELDTACVDDIASKLSDDDAQRILDAGPDGDPTLSDEGEALGEQIFGCVSMDSFVDSLVAEVGEENVDVDCLKEALKGVDPAELGSGDLPGDVFACFTGG